MLEACEYDKTGRMLNNGTWDYKVPGATDIPIDMRVTLLPNAGNSRYFSPVFFCGFGSSCACIWCLLVAASFVPKVLENRRMS